MNAVEIEEALSDLATQPFDPVEFPFSFLASLGNKELTLKRLRKGDTNASDVPGGLLQRSNIHLATCGEGKVGRTLLLLRNSPKTMQAKAKYILATDGVTLEVEDLGSGEVLACDFPRFADHFAFFLSLAGISTVKEIKENPIDVKATGRLNKLYVELLKNNPDWATDARRPDMNHFMARLVFCYFAESTDIIHGNKVFTRTVEPMTEPDGSNTHTVLETIFKAMNTPKTERAAAKLPGWTERFPYVNGGLFSGNTDVPNFTRTARSYLLRAGELTWSQINPDIFGSMIQAVADDEERGSLGMHYTSVPNILKVLNPLFLDDLRAQLEAAGDNKAKLLNLRKRMSRIRVFDPACGSGNFLVIAYKQMRVIEAEINRRRGEPDLRTEIPLTNFRGIELRNFPAEIARLALVIAEFQCDVLHRGQQEALADVLPLDSDSWITCGNALRLDWLSICPPTGKGVKLSSDDLFDIPKDQAEIDFANEGGETYICGNPPYLGSKWQTDEQKSEMAAIFDGRIKNWKVLDYVAAWFIKASDYGTKTTASASFVATNSICQGQQVSALWASILSSGSEIVFAHTSFKWANLASKNAGVTVVIVGISNHPPKTRQLTTISNNGELIVKDVENINPYLIAGPNVIIEARTSALSELPEMVRGNSPTDGGHLLFEPSELPSLGLSAHETLSFVRPFIGSRELISGSRRYCLWIEDDAVESALEVQSIRSRVEKVRSFRLTSGKASTVKAANWPYRFDERKALPTKPTLCVPVISSESRPFLPVDLLPSGTVVSNKAFMLSGDTLWPFSIICSRMNLVWVASVCARMRTDYSYTNTLGWNTLPVPALTEQNKADLTECAEDILLARESHFPKTIADLYDPDDVPQDLRRAHEKNDEVLERIYIGRRFRNDTERLERLFDLYTKKIAEQAKLKKKGAKAK
jgi:hypothetical protein